MKSIKSSNSSFLRYLLCWVCKGRAHIRISSVISCWIIECFPLPIGTAVCCCIFSSGVDNSPLLLCAHKVSERLFLPFLVWLCSVLSFSCYKTGGIITVKTILYWQGIKRHAVEVSIIWGKNEQNIHMPRFCCVLYTKQLTKCKTVLVSYY